MFDIEDLVRAGRRDHACPYYAARTLHETANIVFLPYSYLVRVLGVSSGSRLVFTA